MGRKSSLKIMVVHNRYLERGGEDAVVEAECQLLEDKGHQVMAYIKSNEQIRRMSALQKIVYAARDAYWSKRSYRELSALIENERPDIAHFHNIFHYISPSAYQACFDAGVPVVQSIHNYRFLCPIGTFYRDNRICEECATSGRRAAVRHKCWQGSYLRSAVLTGILTKMEQKKIFNKVNRYIVSSEFSRGKLISHGFPKEKIFLKPNFLVEDPGVSQEEGSYVLFAGTLRPYKGILTLLKAWKKLAPPVPLKIVGTGPLRPEVESMAQGLAVELLGQKPHEELIDLIKSARFVVVPSECYETFSMITLEAYACGKPVVASLLGALTDIVDEGQTGLFFNAGDMDDLVLKIKTLLNDRGLNQDMAQKARKKFEKKYSKDTVYRALLAIYQNALTHNKEMIDGAVRV